MHDGIRSARRLRVKLLYDPLALGAQIAGRNRGLGVDDGGGALDVVGVFLSGSAVEARTDAGGIDQVTHGGDLSRVAGNRGVGSNQTLEWADGGK